MTRTWPTWRRVIVLFCHGAGLLFLGMYLVVPENKYEWMAEDLPGQPLPLDQDVGAVHVTLIAAAVITSAIASVLAYRALQRPGKMLSFALTAAVCVIIALRTFF